uniref:ArfGAP with dual PH domains 2 n=1 Tax=Macaca mulatta TaxID=9544 RepID=A0A5F8AU13_MACMU
GRGSAGSARPPAGPLAHPTPPLRTTGSRPRPPLDPDVGPAGPDPSHPHREPLTRAPRAFSAPGPGPSEPRLGSPCGTRRGSSHVLGPRHDSRQPGALLVQLSSLARHPTTWVRALRVCAPRRAPSPQTQTSQLELEVGPRPPIVLYPLPAPGRPPKDSPAPHPADAEGPLTQPPNLQLRAESRGVPPAPSSRFPLSPVTSTSRHLRLSPRTLDCFQDLHPGRRAAAGGLTRKCQAGRLVRLRWEKGHPPAPAPQAQPWFLRRAFRSAPLLPLPLQIPTGPLTSWGSSSVSTAAVSTVTSLTSAELNPCVLTSGTTVLWRVLKEQWIRAKYERREFMADGETISLPGNREGFLWKRGRDNSQFLRRRFVLLAREGLLKYYTKEGGKNPKAVISIKDLNATFQTEKIGHPHGLQITYRRDGHIRNLFVYHESGKEIVDWFNALRAARLQYLKLAFPELPESELVPFLTRNYLKQGFMEKTGPKQREPFKKRWFALDCHERRLLYYKNPLDAFEQGQVFLGNKEQGYEVYEDLPKGIRGNRWKAGLTIVTPERRYVLTCPNEKEQQEWLESLRGVLSSPLTLLNRLSKKQELKGVLLAKGRGQKVLFHLGSAVMPQKSLDS